MSMHGEGSMPFGGTTSSEEEARHTIDSEEEEEDSMELTEEMLVRTTIPIRRSTSTANAFLHRSYKAHTI